MRQDVVEIDPGELPAVVRDLVAQLAQRPVVEKVILFGSRARGDAEARSDIDLAVVAPEADCRQWLDLVSLVEEAETLLSIDIVRLEEVGEELKSGIIEEGKILYDRSEGDTEPGES